MSKEKADGLKMHKNWPELLKYDQLEKSRQPDSFFQDY